MSQYPNSGVLFKNDHKKEPKHPDYKGKAEVDGVEYQLAAWIKDGNAGKFMSLRFQRPGDRRPSAAQTTMPQSQPEPEPEQDVPF